MPDNPPKNMPRITPYLYYDDVNAALNWLETVFGFERGGELTDADGAIMHAEMRFHGGVLMMGPANSERGGRSPNDLSGVNQSLYVYVEDVDAHFRKSKNSNAPDISEPMDMFWGDRIYTVNDLEGHHWSFAQHTRDIAPEDMKIPSP